MENLSPEQGNKNTTSFSFSYFSTLHEERARTPAQLAAHLPPYFPHGVLKREPDRPFASLLVGSAYLGKQLDWRRPFSLLPTRL
jgi:hypothetical protein